MFCASQLYVYLLRHLPRFPPKVVTVTEVTVFHESVSFPSLEEDNNIYKYIYIIIYYYYLQSESTPKPLYPLR